MKYIAIVMSVITMLCAGCVQHRLLENTRVPEIELHDSGTLSFRGKIVAPDKIADTLEDAGIPARQEINILLTSRADRRLMTYVHQRLAIAGYKRIIFVTKRHTTSDVQQRTNAPIPEPKAKKF